MASRGPRLRDFIRSKLPVRLRSRFCEDDILQEVWIAAFRNRAGFRIDRPDALDRWLTSITQSRLLNMIKSEMRIKRGGREQIVNQHAHSSSFADLIARVVSDGHTPSKEVAVRELTAAIHMALAEMPEARRQAVVYRFMEGKSNDEIAVLMQRTKPAINSLIFNGLRQLQTILGPPASFLSGDWHRGGASLTPARAPRTKQDAG